MADTERENSELKMREALVLRFSQTGLAGPPFTPGFYSHHCDPS